ncbi:hypothetical protein [Actinoallomurus sp. NPDC050550]|uniref:hypothetical protein n=1 Tax=Actinoallomurus sp. NPDC050550 TaxID=3154937 RepID=UPI0033CD40E5
MKHAVVGAGVVGLLSGGLVVASGGSAMAKSNVTLNVAHKVIHSGQALRFAGVVGDDSGLRKARYCLEVRGPQQHWRRMGKCVMPYHADGWTADFRLDTSPLERGRYAFRAVGVGLGHRHAEIYGPSPSVRVTVR